MKLRTKQFIAVQLVMNGSEGLPDYRPAPIILAGGPHAEANRIAMIDNMERIYPSCSFSARVVYRWRNKKKLMQWAKNNHWRGCMR